MAGNYDDPPGHRIPYDRDGTMLIKRQGSTLTDYTSSIATLNNESTNYISAFFPDGSDASMVFIFPRLMDIVGVYLARPNNCGWNLYKSSDTTNGYDGGWEFTGLGDGQWVGGSTDMGPVRNDIKETNQVGVRALEFRFFQLGNSLNHKSVYWVHLYGHPTEPDPETLTIVGDDDQRVDPVSLDLAEVARTSSRDVAFRVRNDTAQVAHDVTVSLQFPTDASPSLIPQHLLSGDGETFQATVQVPQLDPGQTTDTLYLRQVLQSDAQLGLDIGRIVASAGSWG